MRDFSTLKLFAKTNGISFALKKIPYCVIYFPENSTFLDDFDKLKFRHSQFRYVYVPVTKMPRSRLDSNLLRKYESHKFLAFSKSSLLPARMNCIVDLSIFFDSLNLRKITNYRARWGNIVRSLVYRLIDNFSVSYKVVLLYSVDQTKEIPTFFNRKMFSLLQDEKSISIIPNMLLSLCDLNDCTFRLLVKDNQTKFQRLISYLKSIKQQKEITSTEQQKEIEDFANKVVSLVNKTPTKISKEKAKSLVQDLVSKNPQIIDDPDFEVSKKNVDKIVTTAVLYHVNGDLERSIDQSDKIIKRTTPEIADKVVKIYADKVIVPKKAECTANDIAVKISSPEKLNNYNSSSYVFQKRIDDFSGLLNNDIKNSFSILSRKKNPLILEKFEIKDQKPDTEDLTRTELSYITATFRDENNHKHNVKIAIPKFESATGRDGSFIVNGKRNTLLNQLIACPISFPKPYESRFESSYSVFRIHSKSLRNLSYLEIFIAAASLPLFVVLNFMYDYEIVLEKFGITSKVVDEKPKNLEESQIGVKLNSDQYVIFSNVDTELKKQFCSSFTKIKPSNFSNNIEHKYPSTDYFKDLIYEITKRSSLTYVILNIKNNIVDNIAKEVLITKQLPYDLFDIIYYMSDKVVSGYYQKRNDLLNMRVRSSEIISHLVQKEILGAYTAYSEQKLAGNENPKFEVPEFRVLQNFNKLQITSRIEFSNPIEELTTSTRITFIGMGVGGVSSKSAVQLETRNIDKTYFGNIDPLDTPEGAGIGVVQQLTLGALITTKRGAFLEHKFNDENPSKILSPGVAMVPFVNHNDGCRIMMSSNQIKQALPLKNVCPPAVQTGFESVLTNNLSNNFIKISPCNGKITKVTNHKITVDCKGKESDVDLSPKVLASGSGLQSLSVFKPLVKVGEKVKSDQIIANGACLSNNIISLGTNLLTAYMPWKGYNYEDAIVISEKLVKNESLVSLASEIVEVTIKENDKVTFIAPFGDTKRGDPILKRVPGDVVDLLGWENNDEETLINGEMITQSPGGKIINIEVFSNVNIAKLPESLAKLAKNTDKVNKRNPKKKYKVKGSTIKDVLVKFIIQQERNIEAGDKMCNRFGNKGTIALIEKEENMPVLPSGEKVEIIMNPLGVLNRMNVGQLYELYTAYISKELAKRFIQNSFKSNVKLLSDVLSMIDNTDKKSYSRGFIAEFKRLSKTKFEQMKEQVKKEGFFPIIIPPFKGPNLSQIKNAMKYLGLKSAYRLKIPEFHCKTQNPIPIGYVYYYKLEHLSDIKVASRSTGPVQQKSLQPTQGAKRGGGQRLGENDTYSLISYGCKTVLAELMGPSSDDIAGKNEMISNIIANGYTHHITAKQNPTKDLISVYMKALMIRA